MSFNFDLNTFVLGIIQGLCEFLPVSSSGHLAILQNFFNMGNEENLAFDLFLHCATVLAILIYFRREILKIIYDWFTGWFKKDKGGGWLYGWQIFIVTFLTGVIGLPLRKVAEKFLTSLTSIGCGLIFTAIILALVPVISKRNKKYSWFTTALIIGIAQGIAVLPGVSRSGMTIAAGILAGLGFAEAFEFSFIASVPAVLGAALLEGLKALKSGELFMPSGWIFAILIAFILGLVTLNFMRKLVISGRWAYFGLYCLAVGSAVILFSLKIF